MGIHEIMGRKHTTQILDVLNSLGADWMKVEDFYVSELERGAKNILTGQPLVVPGGGGNDVFDYIMGHTNCNPWDWDIKAVPSE